MNYIILPSIFSGSVWQIISDSSTFGLLILIILVIMSLVSWMIIFDKWRLFKEVEADNKKFIQLFRRTRTLSESVGQAKSHPKAPVSHIFMAGYKEVSTLLEDKNEGGAMQESIRSLSLDDFDSVEMAMEVALSEEIGKIERRVVFLATTANSAPFLGLLGTVVGIMDSFWSIGERGSASLAVVAPGIAEALLATIVGLGAAIPAVIAFNWANNKLKFINDVSGNFILEFIRRAKREQG